LLVGLANVGTERDERFNDGGRVVSIAAALKGRAADVRRA